jgi:hypothetical protein
MEEPTINPKAALIVKAIAYTENGGAPDIKNPNAGQSGEAKSVFQFMPDTWKLYAKQVLGDENAPMDFKNESLVAYSKVNNWLNEGHSTEQIASMWNAGEQRPDAYKQGFKGTNTKGVSFDTPAYAKKVVNYEKQFEKESAVTTSQTKPSPLAMVQPGHTSQTTPTTPGMINPKPPTIKELHQQGSMKQPGLAKMKQPKFSSVS